MLAEIRQKDKPAYTKDRLAADPSIPCLVLQVKNARILTATRPIPQPVTFSTNRSTSDEGCNYAYNPEVISDSRKHLPTAIELPWLVVSRHERQSRPLRPLQAERSVGSESSSDELVIMYGAMRIGETGPESVNLDRHRHASEPPETCHVRDTEPEPVNLDRHRHESEPPEPRHARNERARDKNENTLLRRENRQGKPKERYRYENEHRHCGYESSHRHENESNGREDYLPFGDRFT